jgi:hypothetical protein
VLNDAVQSALAQTTPPYEVIIVIAHDASCGSHIHNQWGKKVRIVKVPACSEDKNWLRQIGKLVVGGYGKRHRVDGCGKKGRTRMYAQDQTHPAVTHFAYLDDDDAWLPDKMSIQLAAMKEDGTEFSSTDAWNVGRHDVAYRCHTKVFNPYVNSIKTMGLKAKQMYSGSQHGFHYWNGKNERLLRQYKGNKFPRVIDLAGLKTHNIFITSAVVISRRASDLAGGWDPSPRYEPNARHGGSEDYEFWLRVMMEVKTATFLTMPTVIYDPPKDKSVWCADDGFLQHAKEVREAWTAEHPQDADKEESWFRQRACSTWCGKEDPITGKVHVCRC